MRLIIFLLLLSSCANTVKPGFEPSKPDTMLTVKTFVAFPGDSLRYAPVYRIAKDTALFVDADSSTKVKRFVRDTAYFIPINNQYLQTIKGSVYEGEDLMKGVKMLTKWVQDHRQYWPTKPTPNLK